MISKYRIRKTKIKHLKTGHGCFLPRPFKFIIHNSTLCRLNYRQLCHEHSNQAVNGLPETQRSIKSVTSKFPGTVPKTNEREMPKPSTNIFTLRTDIIFLKIVKLSTDLLSLLAPYNTGHIHRIRSQHDALTATRTVTALRPC